MLKRTVGTILFLLLIIFSFSMGAQASNQPVSLYKDVSVKSFAYSEIMYLTSKNYMSGTSAGYFSPNKYVTRAEVAVVLARSLKRDKPTSFVPNFKDIKSTATYYNAVSQLAELGVVQNSERFRPNELISRAQITVMLAQAYKVEVDSKNNKKFNDVGKNHWAKNYIESVADIGITNGIDGKNFGSYKNVTRGQLAIFVNRGLQFRDKIEKRKLIYDYLAKGYIETYNYSQQWVTEVIRLINIERKKENLPLLVENKHLSQIAVIKAQDMIKRNYFDHKSPYYGQPWDLASIFDYRFTRLGENIARNFNTPQTVTKAWMQSADHRANALRPQYTQTGVAMKKAPNGNFYWVQMFSSN